MALILATNLRTRAEDGSPMEIPWGTPLDELSEELREYALENRLVEYRADEIPKSRNEIEVLRSSFQSDETDDEDAVPVDGEATEAE